MRKGRSSLILVSSWRAGGVSPLSPNITLGGERLAASEGARSPLARKARFHTVGSPHQSDLSAENSHFPPKRVACLKHDRKMRARHLG